MKAINPHKGEAVLEINGITATLKMDLNMLCLIEEHFDAPIQSVFDSQRMGVKSVRDLLWLFLNPVMGPLTQKQVGDMMDFEDIGAYSKTLGELLKSFTKKGKEEDTEGKKPPAEEG